MSTNLPETLHCPWCDSARLILNDASTHAECQDCLFFARIDADGTAHRDLDAVVNTQSLTFDDLQSHPAFLRVWAQRFVEFAGITINDEVLETYNNHFLESNLLKPSGSTLAAVLWRHAFIETL